jgi:hypothetical protein
VWKQLLGNRKKAISEPIGIRKNKQICDLGKIALQNLRNGRNFGSE